MPKYQKYDIAIIGGGPGGMTSAIYAQRAAMKTILLEKNAAGGQMNLSDSIENWPGEPNIEGDELGKKMLQHAKSYGLEVSLSEVSRVSPGLNFHRIELEDGTEIKTHAVVLATGGNPRQLGVKGESENYGSGVSYCAVCDGFFFKDRIVAVVGGGDSAVEESLYLSKIAKKVYLIHRRNELRACGILQERLNRECKIETLWDTMVLEIQGDKNCVNALVLQDKKTQKKDVLPTDGVFIFIGFEPNIGLIPKGIKMSRDGYVITDEKCETCIPGVYAIGDLREKYAKQIITAAADGCTAALAAAHFVEAKTAHKAIKEECQKSVDSILIQ